MKNRMKAKVSYEEHERMKDELNSIYIRSRQNLQEQIRILGITVYEKQKQIKTLKRDIKMWKLASKNGGSHI